MDRRCIRRARQYAVKGIDLTDEVLAKLDEKLPNIKVPEKVD